mmetsp:Transcript_83385/g.231421  ORF Transcript_83385/g.231421 Transcript_83385/m.231421 type:complete len:214 (-) Transcript_83385:53-694(-)
MLLCNLRQQTGQLGGLQTIRQVHCELHRRQRAASAEALDLDDVHAVPRQAPEEGTQDTDVDLRFLHQSDNMAFLVVVLPTGSSGPWRQLRRLQTLLTDVLDLEALPLTGQQQVLHDLVWILLFHFQLQSEAHPSILQAAMPDCSHVHVGLQWVQGSENAVDLPRAAGSGAHLHQETLGAWSAGVAPSSGSILPTPFAQGSDIGTIETKQVERD